MELKEPLIMLVQYLHVQLQAACKLLVLHKLAQIQVGQQLLDDLGYNIRYKPTSGSTWITVSSATNSLAITGLIAGTAYEVQVQNNCGGLLFGAWSFSGNFATLLVATCTDNYETNETRTTNAKQFQ
ncbi:MAG: fibronectin type III domain-containing protein [Bacteroidetes bacterium]|nr:fibronectin type III domain-containing protein [Bacteroidota bacterium]